MKSKNHSLSYAIISGFSQRKKAIHSTGNDYRKFFYADYAVPGKLTDRDYGTRWEPADEDKAPVLTVLFDNIVALIQWKCVLSTLGKNIL